jgi:opacity protein-like surface antigen
MIAVALALGLAAVGGGRPDTDLPRSLSVDETPYLVAPKPAAVDEGSLWIGGHLGVAGAYDADNPAFLIGANARFHILPWLGADGSLDFQTRQEIDDGAGDIFQIPFEFAALFYLPIEAPVRPYGMAGLGWTITKFNPVHHGSDTDLNLLFFLGFGAEFELQPNILLDANLRFVFAQDPPHSGDFSADWIQFTVGIMFKLSK